MQFSWCFWQECGNTVHKDKEKVIFKAAVANKDKSIGLPSNHRWSKHCN